MFPIYDENRAGIIPFVNWLLIALNTLVFIWEVVTPEPAEVLFRRFGALPALVLQGEGLLTLFTSMFLHGDFLHLFGNMLFLYIFGDNIEARFGHLRYLLAYLGFGIVAAYAQAYVTVQASGLPPIEACLRRALEEPACIPAIGASGAVAGVLGAYFIFFPGARIVTVVALPLYFLRIVRIPAMAYLGFWFLWQLLLGVAATLGPIAYWAHAAGFIGGVIVALFQKFIHLTR